MQLSAAIAIASSLIVALWVVIAFRKASQAQQKSSWPLALYFLWIVATSLLAASGKLANFDAFPPPMIGLIACGILLCIAFAFSPWGNRLITQFSLAALIGFNAFRIMPEVLLWRAHAEGLAPIQMTWHGRNLDILAALVCLIAYFLLKRDPSNKPIAWAANLIGLGLLINIIAIAILSFPSPLRQFHNDPANTFVTTFPYIWLPAIQVTAALTAHLLITRKLLAKI